MATGTHGLKRELRLWDLVPMQVVMMVGLGWTGFAAKQGSSQIVLWLLAILCFYLPEAAVVMKLSRALPFEGGVYRWVKSGISPFAGYMAGWWATVGQVAIFASVGTQLAGGFAYAGGPRGAWMATDKPFIMSVALAGCLIAWVLNVCGLHFAKWLSAAGSALTVATFLVMFFLLARAWAIHLPRAHDSLSLALPAFSLGTVGVFTKMALGGLSGFECSAVFSEECRAPENDLRRSVLIAAPLIAAMYMIGTSSLLAYIAPADIDLAAPVGQVMQAGFGGKGLGQVLATATVCGFNIGLLAALVVVVGMVARLPMVAGWDGLLPGWWSTLHPRFGTPTKAIAAVTFAILLLSALSLIDNGNQEAVEATLAAGLGACCLEYMLMFGAVAFGFRSQARDDAIRIHWGIRLAAFSAFLVSFVALIFELLAPGEVANPKVFAFKVGGTIFATTLLGAILYWRGARRLPRGPVKT